MYEIEPTHRKICAVGAYGGPNVYMKTGWDKHRILSKTREITRLQRCICRHQDRKRQRAYLSNVIRNRREVRYFISRKSSFRWCSTGYWRRIHKRHEQIILTRRKNMSGSSNLKRRRRTPTASEQRHSKRENETHLKEIFSVLFLLRRCYISFPSSFYSLSNQIIESAPVTHERRFWRVKSISRRVQHSWFASGTSSDI